PGASAAVEFSNTIQSEAPARRGTAPSSIAIPSGKLALPARWLSRSFRGPLPARYKLPAARPSTPHSRTTHAGRLCMSRIVLSMGNGRQCDAGGPSSLDAKLRQWTRFDAGGYRVLASLGPGGDGRCGGSPSWWWWAWLGSLLQHARRTGGQRGPPQSSA